MTNQPRFDEDISLKDEGKTWLAKDIVSLEPMMPWSKRPIQGKMATFLFAFLVVSMVFIAIVTCSEFILLPDLIRIYILMLAIIIISFIWFAFSTGGQENTFTLARNTFSSVLFSSPIMAMILTDLSLFFWMSLLLICGLALFLMFEDETEGSSEFGEAIRKMVYILWIVVGVITTVGNNPIFSFASATSALAEYHFLLDIRYLISVIMGLLFTVDAIIKAIRSEKPLISPLLSLFQLKKMSESFPIINYLLQPFITMINIVLLGIIELTNRLWNLITSATIYLFRVGSHIADEFLKLFLDSNNWKNISVALATFAIIVIFSMGVEFIAPHLYFYLLSSNIISLLWISGFFFLIYILILSINFFWDFSDKTFEQSTAFSSVIILSLSLSGAIMYGLASVENFQIVGFNSIGIFSALILIFVIVVIVYRVIEEILSKHGNQES